MDYLVVDCIGVITKDDAIVGMRNLLTPQVGVINLGYAHTEHIMCDWNIFNKAHLPKRKSKTFQAIIRAGVLCNQASFINKKRILEELRENMPHLTGDWAEELETVGAPNDAALLKFYEKFCSLPSPTFDAHSEVRFSLSLPRLIILC